MPVNSVICPLINYKYTNDIQNTDTPVIFVWFTSGQVDRWANDQLAETLVGQMNYNYYFFLLISFTNTREAEAAT